ncbi:MAG TPA: sirohydrochlorin chelatase [Trichocoleus sp.]
MLNSSACLLVAHGSRDPRPQIALEHLAKLVSTRSPAMLLGTGFLELAPQPLHQQIQEFGRSALAKGYEHLQVLPLFLLPGVHVMEDIPIEVETAQQDIEPNLTVEVLPYLGNADPWKLLLNPVDEFLTSTSTGKILLAHGSRREGANQPIAQIAAQLNALPAFWSVEPNLETQITTWVKRGCQEIVILPYFLFAGGITDAIEQQVQRLQQQFPYVKLHLNQPIGATPALADLVVRQMGGG